MSLHNIYNGKILLYLFAIALYLPMIFTNVLTILLTLYILLNFRKINLKKTLNKKSVIVFFSMFFLIFIGFFYDISSDGVLNDLEKKLSFIILTFSILVMDVKKEDVRRILALFFLSGILFTSLAICIGLSRYLSTGSLQFITNHGLSLNIGLHATYLSMYLLFSLAYPVLYYESTKKQIVRRTIIFFSILTVIFIILLSVRIVWGILLLFITFWVVSVLRSRKLELKRSFLYLSGFIIVIFLLFNFVSPLKERLKEVINFNSNYNISKTWKPNVNEVWGGRGIRLLIWESSIELIREHPLVGYGSTKEVQGRLNGNYIKNEIGPLLFLMNNRGKVFNAHNQYFEEVLKFGLILGLIFPFLLIIIAISSYKQQSTLGLYFVIIISGISLTETILELNKGIVFFTFFLALILSNSERPYCKSVISLS
ncbi:O-antigen ligase family protein [Bizionia argentinensis JUB59]|uniref:O-antigen ligase family protein n=1 Tax=Bizionia argentinensis JUB59 TaxID=1046627 RepID=G2EES5_9FLAO|nr:O-antigen ligase family protein [Bizionia argentinensis]EGV43054.1 O-antigen ligase family protein [Bizionia argentinensis JUB59]